MFKTVLIVALLLVSGTAVMGCRAGGEIDVASNIVAPR